jgi:hypothetical protein
MPSGRQLELADVRGVGGPRRQPLRRRRSIRIPARDEERHSHVDFVEVPGSFPTELRIGPEPLEQPSSQPRIVQRMRGRAPAVDQEFGQVRVR